MNFTNVDWNLAVQNTLADYEASKNKKTNNYENKVDLTKYFTLALNDKETSGFKSFRILPLDATGKWYEIGKFHKLKVGKNWATLYDPAQDGEESPLNKAYKHYINSTDPEEKKVAMNYRSKEFYIVRGIERGKEHEGIKFWRFPKVSDGSGIMDKILPMMKFLNEKNPGSGAFFNPINGCDLVINIVMDTKGAGKPYPKASQIIFDNQSPLSTDSQQMNTWLNDPLTWRDVFKKKSIEYLTIVAEGSEPFWDTDNKRYIAKVGDMVVESSVDKMPTNSNSNQDVSQNTPKPLDFQIEEPNAEMIEVSADDLPF